MSGRANRNKSPIRQHKHHVWHEMTNIFQYSLYNFPLNRNVRVLGIFGMKGAQHYLTACSDSSIPMEHRAQVIIDLSLVEEYPTMGQIGIVYGELNFENSLIPVIVVKLYKYVDACDVPDMIEVERCFRGFVTVQCVDSRAFMKDILS